MRPVCGAKSSSSGKLSHLLCTILDPIWKSPENTTSCMSTEEMLAEIEKVNKQKHGGNIVVGSADVKALYPSLELEFAIDVVCKEFAKSGVKVEGVNYTEVGLYIAFSTEGSRQRDLGIESLCPSRRHTTGRIPTITASGVSDKPHERYQP